MIKFEFNQTNQELITHYRLSTLVTSDNSDGTIQTLPPDLTPVWMISPGSNGCYPYHLIALPRLSN
jgi:hypothetical protein